MEKRSCILEVRGLDASGLSLGWKPGQRWLYDCMRPLVDFCSEKKGGFMRCEFSVPYKRRSLRQNSLWWALCGEYAAKKADGTTKEEVAAGVKWRAMQERGYPSGRTCGVDMPVSSAKADTVQMSVLVEQVYQCAAEDGIYLQSVEEYRNGSAQVF